ncbi:MAG: RICIN domain-containing protein, partial [Paludibacter sp.]
KVQAFGGTSERQAATTTYRFVSKDRDVFYDGNGPQREYTMILPGGTGYQVGQTNAEKVVNVTWGDDIQPVINGRYMLVNRNSGKVMEVTAGSTTAGASLRQNTNVGATYQQWNVTPVDSRIGGDFSYFTFNAVHSGKAMDLLNFSLINGGSIDAWDDNKNAAQQWYIDYAEDGWFYIRSRQSAKCIEVANSSTASGAIIQQWDKNGGTNQQWRFITVGTALEFVSPIAPSNLVATSNTASIRLDWTASTETDIAGYTVFRSASPGGPYATIARNVKSTSFVDNTATTTIPYFYTIKAVDNCLNRSVFANEVTATATGNKDLITHLQFDGNTKDSTLHLNHAATYGAISYIDGKVAKAIMLNGTDAFVQLPTNVANHSEITIAAWVYWNGTTTGQRIFDFGNSATEYMYLTPKVVLGGLRFAIKNGGSEQILNSTALPMGKWSHVAITLGASGVSMYVNGLLVATSNTININPLNFKPVLNYIGRSQTTYPLFNGNIDDFRIYNYALSANEVAQISGTIAGIENKKSNNNLILSPMPANNILNINYSTENHNSLIKISVNDLNGKLILTRDVNYSNSTRLNVSNIPSGVYILKLINGKETLMKKIIIFH